VPLLAVTVDPPAISKVPTKEATPA
jgi:hypothetical protein